MLFHLLLHHVGEVVEEVNAGVILQRLHAHAMLLDGGERRLYRAVVLMLHPKGDGGIRAVLDAQQGHIVILRHGHAVAARIAEDLVGIVDGAAFHHVERVGEVSTVFSRSAEVLHESFEHHLIVLVETPDLRRHIGHVKRVVVGSTGIKAVGGGAKMPVVVTVETGIVLNGVLAVEFGVFGVLRENLAIFAPHVISTCAPVEAECHPTGMVLHGVIFETISHHTVTVLDAPMRNDEVAALCGRGFEAREHGIPGSRGLRATRIGILLAINDAIVVAAAGKEDTAAERQAKGNDKKVFLHS